MIAFLSLKDGELCGFVRIDDILWTSSKETIVSIAKLYGFEASDEYGESAEIDANITTMVELSDYLRTLRDPAYD